MGFFLGKQSAINSNMSSVENNVNYEELSITVYEDKRCIECPTDDIIDQLQLLPSIS
jgi:hypothetical protein